MVLDRSRGFYACRRVKKYVPTVVNISGLGFLPFKTFFRYLNPCIMTSIFCLLDLFQWSSFLGLGGTKTKHSENEPG